MGSKADGVVEMMADDVVLSIILFSSRKCKNKLLGIGSIGLFIGVVSHVSRPIGFEKSEPTKNMRTIEIPNSNFTM